MSKSIYEPKAVVVLEVTCDRCGKNVKQEFDSEAEPRDKAIPLPEGWVEVGHPNGVDDALTFCQRACTSTWFKAWVRRLYGAPEPGPRRRRSIPLVSDSTAEKLQEAIDKPMPDMRRISPKRVDDNELLPGEAGQMVTVEG